VPDPDADERQRPDEDGTENRKLQITLGIIIELHDGVRKWTVVHAVPPRNHQHAHDESDEAGYDNDGFLEESFHVAICHTDKERERAEHNPCCHH